MKDMIAMKEEYLNWRRENDTDYCYDEIFDFVNSKFTRGDLLILMDTYFGYKEEKTE